MPLSFPPIESDKAEPNYSGPFEYCPSLASNATIGLQHPCCLPQVDQNTTKVHGNICTRQLFQSLSPCLLSKITCLFETNTLSLFCDLH